MTRTRTDAREPTPHERRVAEMTTRERLVFRLIRRVAHLLGRGREFDAECDRLAAMDGAELEAENRRKLAAISALMDERRGGRDGRRP